MHDPVGLLLVGCGRISAAHLTALAGLESQIRLAGVVDADAEAAGRTGAQHGVPAFVDLAAGLALRGVDAVLIASPNAHHADHAAMALAAGKHVLVEKPLAETGAQARCLADMAARSGLVLAAGHTYRHNEAVAMLIDAMPDWGPLRAVEVSSCVFWDGPQAPWWAERKPEEGLILSLFAPHSLDFVQLVMGTDDPLRVQVEAARGQPGLAG